MALFVCVMAVRRVCVVPNSYVWFLGKKSWFVEAAGVRDVMVAAMCSSAFLFSSRRRHTRLVSDWSSDVCSSDLLARFERGKPGRMKSPRGLTTRAASRARIERVSRANSPGMARYYALVNELGAEPDRKSVV